MAMCKYCQKDISWMRTPRKSVPVENDGTVHECEEFKKARASVRTLARESLPPEEIARYERAMNES